MISSHDETAFVSVVMTVHSGGDVVTRYLGDLSAALGKSFPDHELVLVDEASTAGTMDGVRAVMDEIPNIHLIRLTRSPEHDVGITAGLDHSIGDVIVTVEALRDPPLAIVNAAKLVAGGSDVVYGVDQTRTEHRRLTYRMLTRAWHWFFRRTSAVDMPVVDFSLRAVSRRVLNTWLGNSDRDRLLLVMPALSGFGYSMMPYEGQPSQDRLPRSIRGSVQTGGRTIMSATAAPLRIAYLLALLSGFLNLVYAAYVVLIAAVRGDVVEGWVSLSLQSAGMFFLFSIVLAILAEYVFQIVQRTAERPLYRIAEEASSPALSIKDRLNVEMPESPTEAPPGRL